MAVDRARSRLPFVLVHRSRSVLVFLVMAARPGERDRSRLRRSGASRSKGSARLGGVTSPRARSR